MNLLQKAIIRNIRNEYDHIPYSDQCLNDFLESARMTADDPRRHILFMEAYNQYSAENMKYKAKQQAIYGVEFDERIALKRGSKPVKRILKGIIKALKDYPAEIQEKYLPKVKLLLSALKDKQTYTDAEIDEAIDYAYDISCDLCFYGCDMDYLIKDTINSLRNSAYDVECEQPTTANA